MPTLKNISAFCEVARLGSFSGAARTSGLSVASVSRQVSELEQELGVRLFTRSTRQLALTEAGEVFLRRSRSILEDLEEACEETRTLHSSPRGRLRVSAPIAFGSIMLAPILPEFQAEHPDVEVELDISTRFVNLLEDQVDVAFRVEGPDGFKDSALVARKLFVQSMIFVATPNYVSRYGDPVHIDRLADHNIVQQITGNFGRRWVLESGDERQEISLPGKTIVTSPIALLHAVLSGHSMGLVLDYLVEEALQDGRLVRVLGDWSCPNLPIHMVYAHRKHVPGKVRTFVEFVFERLSRL